MEHVIFYPLCVFVLNFMPSATMWSLTANLEHRHCFIFLTRIKRK